MKEKTQIYHWGFSLLAVGAATLAAFPLRDHFNAINLVMFYIAAVVVVAARAGTGPSILASVIGVSAFNFFFTEPYYTFDVYDTSYVFTFIVMLITSLIVGSLASRLREQAIIAHKREVEAKVLYALAGQLANVQGKHSIVSVAERHLAARFGGSIQLFLPDGRNLPRDLKEQSAVKWALEHGEPAGPGTNTYPGAEGFYLPLIAEKQTVGALGILSGGKEIPRPALEAHAALIASALLRARKARQAEEAQVESETEKTRNLMLRSISHDLRTPLASIRGNIEAALATSALPPQASDLLASARHQSEQLTHMLTNLLDLTRLETGITLNRQPYYIDEVIGAALETIRPQLKDRIIKTTLASDLPLVAIDGLLIQQVMLNLLENAIRHTADKGTIMISAFASNTLEISVSDNGSGIAPGEESRIFEKFYHGDTGTTGLGLAICKGIVSAHGGLIEASRNPAGGLTIRFTLPFAEAERKSA